MISEHASPLASLGGEDSGGQNVYVAELARRLGEMGHEVDVFTRRDSELLPAVVPLAEGVRVVNLPAGPARSVPKDELFPFMYEFRD
ncbi:MAG TPA: glycosyltransferase, partial [Armatimonadota bacterium]|nr:glycosyltransferase [Armatimonadota bacterium]